MVLVAVARMSITAKAAAVACGALVLLLAGQTWRLHSAQLAVAQARTDLATHTAAAERAARQQTEAYRALETQHRDRLTNIDTDTTAALATARTDAARAVGTAERLRSDLAAYITQLRARAQAAAAAGQCPPDPGAGRFQEDLAFDAIGGRWIHGMARAGNQGYMQHSSCMLRRMIQKGNFPVA